MSTGTDGNRIRQIIHKMISEEAHLEEGLELADDIRLIENLGFDSVQLISLIAGIEEEFDIEFMGNNMLFDRFSSFGDLCSLVKEMIEEKEIEQGEGNGTI